MFESLITLSIFLVLAFIFWNSIVSFPLTERLGNWLLRKLNLQDRPIVSNSINSGLSKLIGTKSIVLQKVTTGHGRIKVRGSEWNARTSNNNEYYQVGETVVIVGFEGSVLVVGKGNIENA